MLLGKQSQRVSAGWPGLVLVAIATFILVSSPMLAPASQIHFDIDTLTAGTISWAGGDSPLVGTDIEVDQVMGLDTPNHPDVRRFNKSAVVGGESVAEEKFSDGAGESGCERKVGEHLGRNIWLEKVITAGSGNSCPVTFICRCIVDYMIISPISE